MIGETLVEETAAQPRREPQSASPGRQALLDRLAVALVLIGAWHGASIVYGEYWISSPSSTLARLATELGAMDLLRHTLYTASEAALGLALGSTPAIALPFLLRRRPMTTAIIEPFMTAGYGAPKLALAPLFILWFGLGLASKVALVTASAFFIVYVNTMAGIRTVDPRLVQMARAAGARERDLARLVFLPAALPYIFAGVRIALPYSIGGAVVAELLSANRDLGYLVQFGATTFDTTGVFVALLMVGASVLAGHVATTAVERRLAPARPRPRGGWGR